MDKPSLFEQVPDAVAFCTRVCDSLSNYLLCAEERFVQCRGSVLASTALDRQGERLSPAYLEAIVGQIAARPLWLLVEHDPRIQPVGRVLASKVFYAGPSETHFVAGVLGYYDQDKIPPLDHCEADVGSVADWPTAEALRQVGKARLGYNVHDIAPEFINELLETAPPIVSRDADSRFYKSEDVLTIITIALGGLAAISFNPFIKKVQEKIGDQVGQDLVAMWNWVKGQLIDGIARHRAERLLFVLESPYKGCRVDFVIASNDPNAIRKAIDGIHDAGHSAKCLIDHLEEAEPDVVTYEFDCGQEKWLPLHAVTRRRGVLSNRPKLIALDKYAGLSIAGVKRIKSDNNRKAIE